MAPNIPLTPDEALVLLNWLRVHDEADDLSHDDAEQRALWNLEAALESVVSDAFLPDYEHRLAEAKTRLSG